MRDKTCTNFKSCYFTIFLVDLISPCSEVVRRTLTYIKFAMSPIKVFLFSGVTVRKTLPTERESQELFKQEKRTGINVRGPIVCPTEMSVKIYCEPQRVT